MHTNVQLDDILDISFHPPSGPEGLTDEINFDNCFGKIGKINNRKNDFVIIWQKFPEFFPKYVDKNC